MAFNNILVVCVGNICRSPMAEALLQQQHPNLLVVSAGIQALVGESADEKAITVMDAINIDIRAHRAQQLTSHLLQAYDLILCMSYEQEKWIKQQWPYQRGKVFRLGHWLNTNIADPYTKSIDVFYDTRDLINQAVISWQAKLN